VSVPLKSIATIMYINYSFINPFTEKFKELLIWFEFNVIQVL